MKPVLQNLHHGEAPRLQCFDVTLDRRSDSWHYHPEIEICYVKEGSGLCLIGNCIEAFQPRDLIVCGSNLPHNYVVRDRASTAKATVGVIQFPIQSIPQEPLFKGVHMLLEQSRAGLAVTGLSEHIATKLARISDASPIEQFLDLLAVLHAISESGQVRRLASEDYLLSQRSDSSMTRFSRVHDYLLSNLDRAVSLSTLADQANMAPQSFCRWFKKIAGQSFTEYSNRLKIEHACQLLVKSPESVASVASQVGFGSISQFNRSFRRFKSITPREYRSIYRAT